MGPQTNRSKHMSYYSKQLISHIIAIQLSLL